MNFTLGKVRAFFMQTKNIIATSIWNKCNIFVSLCHAQAQIYIPLYLNYIFRHHLFEPPRGGVV